MCFASCSICRKVYILDGHTPARAPTELLHVRAQLEALGLGQLLEGKFVLVALVCVWTKDSAMECVQSRELFQKFASSIARSVLSRR